MELSNKPTNFILLKAGVSSEWDDCNYAIAYIGEDTIDKIIEGTKVINELKDKYHNDVYSLSLWGNVTFLDLDEEGENIAKITESLNGEKPEDYAFVETDFDEIDSFDRPGQSINAEQLHIGSCGTISWIGYGKHTGEEFLTEDIMVDKFLKKLGK